MRLCLSVPSNDKSNATKIKVRNEMTNTFSFDVSIGSDFLHLNTIKIVHPFLSRTLKVFPC